MARIDLNAARAARREARQGAEPITLIIDDVELELPAEMPLAFLDKAGDLTEALFSDDPNVQARAAGLIRDAAKALLGVAVYDELLDRHALTMDDLRLILGEAGNLYGVGLGNSSASAQPSAATSAP